MKLRYTPHARGQLDNIAEHIAKRDPAASARVGAQIHRTALFLTEFPLLGVKSELSGTREYSSAANSLRNTLSNRKRVC